VGFRWGNLRKRDHLEDLIVAGRIKLKQNFKKWDGELSMDWIHLAQEREWWLVIVNAVINLCVP
jgi:hypothetical protein